MKAKFVKFLSSALFAILIVFKSVPAYADSVPSLSFSWDVPVALSVFEREDYIWIVFDRRKNVDLSEIKNTLRDFEPEVLQVPHSKATILRVKINKKVTPYVRKEGYLWIVDFLEYGKTEGLDSDNLEAIVQIDSFDNQYLFVPTTSFVEPISVVDPDVGDMILVEASVEGKTALRNYYDFVDFEILSSAQGFAIVPRTEDVYIIRGKTGVSVKKRDTGIIVSENLDSIKRNALMSKRALDGNELKLEVSDSLLNKPFVEAEAMLKRDIENAEDALKDRARFELAKFYAAKALGVETIKTIDEILANENTTLKKDFLYALRGVGNFLTARYQSAINDFSYGSLLEKPEAQFWLEMILIADPKTKISPNMSSFAPIIKKYPKELKRKISFIAAQHAINVGDDLSAQNFLDVLKLEATEQHIPVVHYLIAQNLYAEGFVQDALKELNFVAKSSSAMYSAYARLDAALLAYKLKSISAEDTIKELERLRYTWGEKLYKANLFGVLTKIYIENKDYTSAVATMTEWRKISNPKQQELIDKQIILLFEELYLENQADEVQPLKALSLYKEYIDIIAQSKKYVDIDINVADRFLAVDLVEKAKEILEAQLKNADITLEQKYKIGTRLALIYTYQNLPDEVIKVLDLTEKNDPVINLDDYRKVLRAIAYKETQDYDKALEILEGNYSQVAVLLKSEIYWQTQDWDLLSSQLRYLINDPVEGEPINDEQVKYILDWLMALKKAKKEIIITRARAKLLPWFENTKYYTTFDMLTSQFDYNKVDMQDIENKINSMSMYSDFAKKVNENLAKVGSISEVKND